ncbi:hypothetical protein ACIBAI_12470 [Streptomyces sp. NPDC051041]|uniref:hypothetical protein n=1 Tax=Streptomyces sp. NPDC051041 TaxID=3365640 RepID=UPI0037A1ED91
MLIGIVACAVVLPLAVASAGSVGFGAVVGSAGEEGRPAVRFPARSGDTAAPPGGDAALPGDGKARAAHPAPSRLRLDPGQATAVRCGPELAAPGGVEAQTCVLTQGEETWARTYYRNLTGDALHAVLSLLGPGSRAVRLHCAVGAGDEPGLCETPRERLRAAPAAYTAVTEFARRTGSGPLLLRSASNSPMQTGS